MSRFILSFILFCTIGINVCFAQKEKNTTIILIRHAEKDTTQQGSTMMAANPPLSEVGKKRAVRLIAALKDYQPSVILSTNYTRTIATVTPLAEKFGKTIQLYDPKKLPALADSLLQLQQQTIVVAGHSNSTPALVNLLIKENKYPALDESVYNMIWIVTVDPNKKVSVITKTYE